MATQNGWRWCSRCQSMVYGGFGKGICYDGEPHHLDDSGPYLIPIGERLKRLQREGFIEGYGARLNPHRLGLGLLVFVEVLLDKTTPDNFERFARAVKLAPEVLECHMVAGGFDYLVKARLADMTAYRRFLGETLLAMPGVRETRTYAVMEEIKRDAPLPVE